MKLFALGVLRSQKFLEVGSLFQKGIALPWLAECFPVLAIKVPVSLGDPWTRNVGGPVIGSLRGTSVPEGSCSPHVMQPADKIYRIFVIALKDSYRETRQPLLCVSAWIELSLASSHQQESFPTVPFSSLSVADDSYPSKFLASTQLHMLFPPSQFPPSAAHSNTIKLHREAPCAPAKTRRSRQKQSSTSCSRARHSIF